MSWRMQIIYLVPVTRQREAPVRLVLRGGCQLLALQCSPSINIICCFFFFLRNHWSGPSAWFFLQSWQLRIPARNVLNKIFLRVCFSNALIRAVLMHTKKISCSWSGYGRTVGLNDQKQTLWKQIIGAYRRENFPKSIVQGLIHISRKLQLSGFLLLP